MSIPTSFIDQLLDQTDIVDVVGRRIPLNKKGSNFWCQCPFHDDSNPSMAVNQEKQFFYCFVCQESGNAIHFLRQYENLEFVDAIETLASSAGMTVPYENSRSEKSRPSGLVEKAVKYYQANLNETTAPKAVQYLKDREITGTTAKKFNIGYALDKWDGLLNHLGADIPQKELDESGLFSKKDDRFYDRFRGRIIFPIRNIKGDFIAMGGRIIDEGEPKYLNSPETSFFNKSNELFGLYEVKELEKNIASLIIVEGYMDVIGLYEHGIKNAVATLGTAVTPNHVSKIMRYTNKIYFAFDGDLAGGKAAWKAVENTFPIIREDINIHFVFFEQGHDPDSFINEHGLKAFQKLLDESVSLSSYFLSKVKEFNLETLEGRAQAASFAIPIINKINNSVIKEVYTSEISKLCGMDIKTMDTPSSQTASFISDTALRASSTTPVRVKAVINIFSALLAFPSIAQESLFDELKNNKKFDFLFIILDLYRKTPDIKPSRVIESLESDQIKGYFSEAVVAGLELSEKNALMLVSDCMDILLKNQKDREQTLKDKYNVRSITPVERRDLQQIILKKQDITDDDRHWLEKLSSKQD
ncbi:DNA primase [SAR86 cluster bacterium SAR86E]|jgi:DNA primase|uniref:DNA primase n=1 Tax=SAR86 cluster bacterium SAR86E TaxID=1208365 RepID=K6H100_9GAMM|nr:DNA primase [SAR86 cluster bacterium SAR86E]